MSRTKDGLGMRASATYDDVNLMLKLYETRREARMRQARDWFARHFSASTMEEFQQLCPPGTEENASLRMVVSYWEMVASFITGGVLNCELFYHNTRELLVVWERCRLLIGAMRQARKDPLLYANLETVATDYIQWIEKRAPGSYEIWAAGVRKPAGPPPK